MSKSFGDDLFEVFDEEPTSVLKNDNSTPTIKRKSSQSDNGEIEEQEPKKPKSIFDKINEVKDEYVTVAEEVPKESTEEVKQSFRVDQIYQTDDCTHEVVLPGEAELDALKAGEKPAKEYKFTLDTFQKQATMCLENSQSVLVSAHTSAGKTVVAEYAIAMSFRNKQKVIYTTPIKALSNQKFREFQEEFQDVGLMTGDTTINPNASCLIMTTEILRSMLYRGSELTREVAWVIFDEIHYMRDKMRGVVWEETIILLPDNVRYVFLSATIPNARQFAEWIVFLHKQPVHVVYTEKRPVPLQHYVYPAGGDGVHLVLNEKGEFKEDNLSVAMDTLAKAGEAGMGDQRGRRGGNRGQNESNVLKVVRMITEKSFTPVIIFSFSRKECEEHAVQLSKLDLNSDTEKEHVEKVFKNAMMYLSDDDRKLPQVDNVLPLLKKGIGIHHSGLLPLLKETIEILFGEGLIKALFATETFAMGLNMPAKTVVFTQTEKFDGVDVRPLTSGEYIQMSGRAGRRGLDEKGIVIMMMKQRVTPAEVKNMLGGAADPLNSAFHLTYNMVLNLMRVEEVNPEYMLERSFYQFQNYSSLPALERHLKDLEMKYISIKIPRESEIESYHKLRRQLKQREKELLSYIQKAKYIVPWLKVGRLIEVKHEDTYFGWGAVVNVYQKTLKEDITERRYFVDVTLDLDPSCLRNFKQGGDPKPSDGKNGEMTVVPITLKTIQAVSQIRILVPDDLKSKDKRQRVKKDIDEVRRRQKDGMPLLDPQEDFGIKEEGFKDTLKKIEALEKRLYSHTLTNDTELEELYNVFESKMSVGDEVRKIKSQLKAKKSLLQMEELKCRKRVLRRLGYATAQDVIEIKGRVACEIDSVDELLVTELLFENMFDDLSPSEVAAVMSCFVFDEKCSEMPKLTDTLSGTLRKIQEAARKIAKVCIDAKIELDEEEYVERLKPYLMDIVYAWCEGAKFSKICEMTDIFEGSIVRSMRRLAEVMRQLVCAAKAIGNTNLENKFSESIRLLKRDIVFAASLYL